MQATLTDKIQFYTSIILVNVCLLALVWSVSPISLLKPDTRVYAAPVAAAKKPIKIIAGKPVRIVLASISIDLPVVDGYYDPATGAWTLASKKVFYATPTPLINDTFGNTLIYGHNNKRTLWNMKYIAPGAELLIYTDSGYLFHYTYTSAQEVQPDDTSVLDYDGSPPIVTLQTCSGTWSQYRKMFRFDLKSIDKPSEHA